MPEGLSFESYRQVSKLRPFGIGNPKPIFVTNGLVISGIAQMSNGAHIRLDLTDSKGEANLSAVGFGMGDYYNILRAGDTIDIAYTINEYCYRGETSLSLHLEDIRPRYEEGFMWQKADIAEKLYTSGLAMNQIAKMAPGENIESEMKPTSEQFGACYKAIEKFGGTAMSTVDIDLLARLVSNNYDVACTPFQVKRCLEVFADCNLIRLRSVTPMTVCFNILKTGDKVKLSDSEVYRRIIGD
jgi:single-stranded-DNA-specific exonuclease